MQNSHGSASESFNHVLALHGIAFLQAAYMHILGRPIDADGQNTYTRHMQRGMSKLAVLATLYESEEGRAYAGRIADFSAAVAEIPLELTAIAPGSLRIGSAESLPDSDGGSDPTKPQARSIAGLLSLDDIAFVEGAYRTLLCRAPDAVGLVNYLTLLREGSSKLRILAALRGSREGRRHAQSVQGLDLAIISYRLARIPVVGWLLRLVSDQEGDSRLECRIRRIANLQVRTALAGVHAPSARNAEPYGEDLPVTLPRMEDPRVSVIIPMHNQLEYTLKCLRSLADCGQETSFEVIVIDDKSDLAEFRALSRVVNLRVLRNFENQGFLRSCNRAARYARGQYVVLLNNDTEVTGDWLDALMRVFETRPDAGLVGSKLIYPDGSLQEAGGIVWQDGGAWNYGRGDDASRPAYNYVRETDYCSAASVMLPTELWKALGGFDLRYIPAYCEDSDLAFRVREAGYKVYVQPKSVVVHHEGKSNGTDTAAGIKHYQVLNHRKLVERWGAVFAGHRPNGVDVFRARERSLDRPVILFIDHYLPHFDQDAGSRTIWAFVRLFLDEGFSVKFLGDNFHPHQPYQQIMEEMGIEVLTGPWMAEHWEEWLAENGKYLDYVMLSRAHTSQRYLEPLRRSTKAKILYYGHDLISRTARNQYAFTKDPAKLEEAKRFRDLEAKVYEMVDVVYYPSQLEIDELAITHPQLNAQVVTPYVYERVQQLSEATADRFATRRGLLFVGGFRHPPNAEAVLWFCSEVMPVLVEKMPGIHLTIAGSNPPPEVSALAGPNVTVTGYVSDDELARLYSENRLVVVPLLTGGGIKGKVIEAMSYALPIMTTPVGAEGIPEAETAMRIASPETFAEELLAIYSDAGALAQMAACGADIIKRYYSLSALKSSFATEVLFTTTLI